MTLQVERMRWITQSQSFRLIKQNITTLKGRCVFEAFLKSVGR